MALASSRRSSATGGPSFAVHSIHVRIIGRHVALCADTTLLGNTKVWRLGARGFDKKDVVVQLGLRLHFC